MAKKIQQPKRTRIIEIELNRVFSPEWLRETAKETGFVKRDRKIDPVLMFWSLTLGLGVQLQRTLASLRRIYYAMQVLEKIFGMEVQISWLEP